jgi:DNA-binding MarR family transcriptional regulator
MMNKLYSMGKERDEALIMELLAAIEASSAVTQRHLADRLGVALGLANSYLKRCARKGYIKVTQAPANRYLYYLTPKGFAEKARLTAQYLGYSFDFYRRASESMAVVLAECERVKLASVLLGGVSELAEIASVRAHDYQVAVVGTLDPRSTRERFVGRPVWRRIEDCAPALGCVYTALVRDNALIAALRTRYGERQLLVPGVVRPVLGMPPARPMTVPG